MATPSNRIRNTASNIAQDLVNIKRGLTSLLAAVSGSHPTVQTHLQQLLSQADDVQNYWFYPSHSKVKAFLESYRSIMCELSNIGKEFEAKEPDLAKLFENCKIQAKEEIATVETMKQAIHDLSNLYLVDAVTAATSTTLAGFVWHNLQGIIAFLERYLTGPNVLCTAGRMARAGFNTWVSDALIAFGIPAASVPLVTSLIASLLVGLLATGILRYFFPNLPRDLLVAIVNLRFAVPVNSVADRESSTTLQLPGTCTVCTTA